MRTVVKRVRGAYFCYPIRPGILQATAYFSQAAKEAGVDCIVNMSQKSAREDANSHAAQDHWLSEQVFDWSGITVTHLRPTYFAEWLLYLAPMIGTGLLHLPFGTGRHAPIAAELSYAEVAEIASRVLGTQITYQQANVDAFAESLGQTGNALFKEHCRAVAVELQEGVFAGTNSLAAQISGRQPMTVEEFVTKNRNIFI